MYFRGLVMETSSSNSCYEAFGRLCEEEADNKLVGSEEFQYWMFERGCRAAIQGLLEILESKNQTVKFESPKLQSIADKLLS